MKLVINQYNPKLAENIIETKIPGNTKCIFCGAGMGLCAHCFSRDIYDYLQENDSEIAEVFLSRFDFDLRRSGC